VELVDLGHKEQVEEVDIMVVEEEVGTEVVGAVVTLLIQ
jgi:hypothetical protein